MKKLLILAVLVLLIVSVYALGPEQKARKAGSVNIGDDPVVYLEQRENAISDIWQGSAKEIIWFDGIQKTSIAIVYIHGFTASKHEIRPLPDLVAEQLEANIFYTRLAGHGRSAEALASVHWQDWRDDLREAVAIGRYIGDKLVVVASSAGASLMIANSDDQAISRNIVAMINISPIFGIPQTGLGLAAGPWGSHIVQLLAGDMVSVTPINEQHRQWWTTSYPSRALVPLAITVRMANQVRFENATIPALFIYSPDDKVVLVDKIAEVAGRWGSVSDSIIVTDSSDPGQHVIAGDIRSPETTVRLANQIVSWIQNL